MKGTWVALGFFHKGCSSRDFKKPEVETPDQLDWVVATQIFLEFSSRTLGFHDPI